MSNTASERTVDDLVFTGFNRRVVALDRYTGETAWTWKAPSGSGYATLMLDGDRLIVAVSGYMYCLDPVFGQLVWKNPLRGLGTGVMSLCSKRGGSAENLQANAAAAAAAAAAATAAT